MRILALTNLYPFPSQPHRASFNRLQFSALAQEHEVRVIAPIAWTGLWPEKSSSAQRAESRGPRVRDGLIVHHPTYVFTPKVLRGWYGQFMTRSVRSCFQQVVRDMRPEVVLGCWAYPDGWAAVRLAKEAGLPVAVKVHGSDLLSLRTDEGGVRRYAATAEALACADAVIAVSGHLRDKAVSMGVLGTRTHLIRNGIDMHRFHPGSPEEARRRLGLTSDEPLVLFVGNLLPVKGLDILIQALWLVRCAGVRFQCVCVGDGPLKSQLRSRIGELGLAPRVRLVGACPQEALPDWYRAAAVLVLPSRSEGVPNVLMEAAACGTPVIASRVGGVPELCHPASLVPPEDPRALAAQIRLFLDPATRPAAPTRYTPGSWQDSARALADVLGQIAEERSSQMLRAA
jgi:glycosyltransferase involved in cell wall biosynthesis